MSASGTSSTSPRPSTELHVHGTGTESGGRISISSSSSNPPPQLSQNGPEWTPLGHMSDQDVRAELERVREERDGFEGQYRGLLSKLTQMRSTLGDRLRQDAEELDRREHQIEDLTARTSELEATISTLKSELLSSHAETERITAEADTLRSSITASTSASSSHDLTSRLERERELQETLEGLKMDCEGWESACLEERARREELESTLREALSDKARAEQREEAMRTRAEREEQSARELQAVLEEFQSAQETELRRALGNHQEAYETLTLSLSQHKARAEQAEFQLSQYESAAKLSQTLTAEVKEKNLLIGKLRHEAVILNEHLTEALRRLRNDSSENNVDRKLMTNLLLQFLTTPRTDGKRFEMLNLIASVLGWSDTERETAGLQKIGTTSTSTGRGGWGMGTSSPDKADGKVKGHSRSAVAGDESFSNLFVEFLLSEADAGSGDGGSGSASTTASRSIHLPLKQSSPGATTDESPRRPSIPNPSSSLTRSFSTTSLRDDNEAGGSSSKRNG